MTETSRWGEAYLADLDQAAAGLPPDRRAELLTEVAGHLTTELATVTDDDEARAVLDRLGDPAALVAEAAVDLPPAPARPAGPSAGEIVALLLMGIGGIALPLIAPAMGAMIMRSTPRWTSAEVRTAWAILGVGVAAVGAGLLLMMLADGSSVAAVRTGVLLLGVVVIVGPASALYAATRPRP